MNAPKKIHAHVLIAGMTLSGKTTLARDMAKQYAAAGLTPLVLDPMADPRWPTEFRTSDQNQFLEWYWHSEQCVAFMDEGGESVGRYNDAMTETATRGRHFGHINHYIVQEATQIAKIIRSQCTRLYLFHSAIEDGDTLARAWNHPELRECNKLKTGEYFYAEKMGPCQKYSLFGDIYNETDNRTDGSGNRDRRSVDPGREESDAADEDDGDADAA